MGFWISPRSGIDSINPVPGGGPEAPPPLGGPSPGGPAPSGRQIPSPGGIPPGGARGILPCMYLGSGGVGVEVGWDRGMGMGVLGMGGWSGERN